MMTEATAAVSTFLKIKIDMRRLLLVGFWRTCSRF
jgi:hypothetical protein